MREVPDVDSIFQTWYLLTALPKDERKQFLDTAMWRISNSDFAYLKMIDHGQALSVPLIEYNKNTQKYTMFGVVIDICRNVDCRYPQLVLTIDKRKIVP